MHGTPSNQAQVLLKGFPLKLMLKPIQYFNVDGLFYFILLISLRPPAGAKYRDSTARALFLNIFPNIWPSTKGIRKDVPNVSQVPKPLHRENSASAGGSLKPTQVRIVKYGGAVSHRAACSVALHRLHPKTVAQMTTAARKVIQPVPEIRRDP